MITTKHGKKKKTISCSIIKSDNFSGSPVQSYEYPMYGSMTSGNRQGLVSRS